MLKNLDLLLDVKVLRALRLKQRRLSMQAMGRQGARI